MKSLARSSVLFLLLWCSLTACERGAPPAPPAASEPAPAASAAAAALPSGAALAPNAPKDQPVSVNGKSKIEEIRAAMAPHIEEARKTYPDAKRRYLAGLPRGEVFFAVAKLRDAGGAEEQAFIAVTGIKDGKISGKIASDILGVEGFKRGDAYTLPEAEMVDWLISKPDGTEEGNFVGKFLDEWQRPKSAK
jgi:hypothetical protein